MQGGKDDPLQNLVTVKSSDKLNETKVSILNCHPTVRSLRARCARL